MLPGLGFLRDLEPAQALLGWDVTPCLDGILGGRKPKRKKEEKKKKTANGTQLKDRGKGASVYQSKCFHSLLSPTGIFGAWGGSAPLARAK